MERMNMFRVILNGCNIESKPRTIDIREKYNIGVDCFVFAFVGNVGENKNQKQVVDAFELIPEEYQEKISVLFVGGGKCEELIEYVKTKNLQERLIVCGLVSKDEIQNYYYAANATVLTSKSEGFGLSIIEGMTYGLPCLTYSDLPAVVDLYNEKSMLLVEKRDDRALAQGMILMTQIKWDKTAIKQHSAHFSFDNMAKQYIKFYKDITES